MTYDPAALREVFERSTTYWAGFRRNVHRFAAAQAIYCPERQRGWTYAELGADVDALAAGLVSAGVRPGEVVVYQLFNGVEFALLYLATQQCGAVGAPINFRLSAGETAYVLDAARPVAYLYDADLSGTATEALRLASHAPATVLRVGGAGDGRAFDDLLDAGRSALAAGAATPSPPGDVTVYSETTRLFTSGTTGMPKGVPLPNLVEVFSAHDVIMHFPLSPYDRTLNMTPWFHRGGLYSGGPNPVFYVGAACVPMRTFEPARCLDFVADLGLTFLIGAPTNLALLATEQEARPRDLSTLRGIVTMGSPLDRAACLRYQKVLTPRIFNGYGTTESFWNTFLRPEDLPEHAGTAGRACTDDDVAVVVPGGAPTDDVPRDGETVGEVLVRSVKAGYAYDDAATTAQKFAGGWFATGDLATWDEGEFVTIVGRRDDMIISGGENVHPVQVEAVLAEHPAVADAAVVGVPDPTWGRLLVAYVVTAEPVSAAELDRHCREHPMLADFKRPRRYRFVSELPMTATGKKVHYRITEIATADAEAGLLESPT
ncbi:MAG TPA: AMP-binding protein [Mycobacteriales bacterium]